MSSVDVVAVRALIVERPRVRIPLLPGDRIVATAGMAVTPGDLLAERVRDPQLVETSEEDHPGGPSHAGAWVAVDNGPRGTAPAGEVLFEHGGRRRIVTGPHPDLVSAPAAGRVIEIHPGVEIVLDLDGLGISAAELLGDAGHGRLALLPGDGEGRVALDVAHAGSIVVVPGRVDAETLTRARAMGIAGAVVPALSERDRRDVVASEARQRAGLHRLAPFPVLVLDGYLRRPLAAAIRDLLVALQGTEVGLVGHPPMLVTRVPAEELPRPAADRVRLRGGRDAGHEGSLVELVGPRCVGAGVTSEAARVQLDDGRSVVVGLGELERFA